MIGSIYEVFEIESFLGVASMEINSHQNPVS